MGNRCSDPRLSRRRCRGTSAWGEYACLALIALAQDCREGRPLSRTCDIARKHNLRRPFLLRILGRLRMAGLVESELGPSGGYRLARPAEQISLGEALTAVEGHDSTPGTVSVRGRAARALESALERARAAERAVLDRTWIAQLVEPVEGLDGNGRK